MAEENKIQVKIYTPEKIVVNEEADFAAVTTMTAYNGFYPKHAPFVMALAEKGHVKVRKSGNDKIFQFQGSGHMEYKDKVLVVLTEKVLAQQ